MSGSPLIYDDLVLVNPGNQKGTGKSLAITAFDTRRRSALWGGGETKAGYSSPMLGTLGGVRQMLIFDGVGLAGYDPADGRELWRSPWKSDFDINAAQPIVLDDQRVVITSAAGAVPVRVQADGQVDRRRDLAQSQAEGRLHLPDRLQGLRLSASTKASSSASKSDRRASSTGRIAAASSVTARCSAPDDLLLVLGEAGELALVESRREKFRELGRIQAIEGKTWNNPTLVGGRIFVRNHLEMAAYDLPLAEPPAEQK